MILYKVYFSSHEICWVYAGVIQNTKSENTNGDFMHSNPLYNFSSTAANQSTSFLSISGHYTLKRICSFEKMNKIMFFCFAVILFVAVAKSFLFKPPRKGRNSIVRAAKTRKKPVILLFLSLFSWKTCKRPLAQQMLSSSAT